MKPSDSDLREVLNSLNNGQTTSDVLVGLRGLQDVQAVTSALVPGCIPETAFGKPTKEQVATFILALQVEVAELVQELNWKPWKEEKSINKERVADEFADILAFLGIIVEYLDRLGVPPGMLADQYSKKSRINVDRFLGKIEGYRLSTKQEA